MSTQSQVNVGVSVRLRSQDDVSQKLGDTPLSFPQFNRLIESSFVWDENSTSNTDVTVIPSRSPNRFSVTDNPSLTVKCHVRVIR